MNTITEWHEKLKQAQNLDDLMVLRVEILKDIYFLNEQIEEMQNGKDLKLWSKKINEKQVYDDMLELLRSKIFSSVRAGYWFGDLRTIYRPETPENQS